VLIASQIVANPKLSRNGVGGSIHVLGRLCPRKCVNLGVHAKLATFELRHAGWAHFAGKGTAK
jgi:hypothetical protein